MLAYESRLYPDQGQERKLLWTLEVCSHAYNRFPELYLGGEHDRYALQALPPKWKESDAELRDVYSKVLQYEVYRLFSNLSALREMKKHGRKVGKLRFKPANRFRTFTHNQSGFDLLPKNEKFSFLRLSKIDDIPIRLHREVVGNIKGVTIKHMPSGKWYMYILVDDSDGNDKLTVIDKTVGIDVGLEHFIVDSDGNEIENSQHIRRRYA